VTKRRSAFASWPSEHATADLLPIECTPSTAAEILEAVPFWFHTFSLSKAAGIYTPGVARDHGYRLASIPESFEDQSVLDVGTFDGFYAFLAEHRGAARVVAVDNEQYRHWVRDRWGIDLQGAEGFKAIAALLASEVRYERMDALDLATWTTRFDVIFCFGILHRVRNPFGLLKVLTGLLAPGGRLLIETAGIEHDAGAGHGAMAVPHPREVNARDDYFYWQFSSGSLAHLAEFLGCAFETHSTPIVDGQPRLVGHINAATPANED